jgi:hypothetical protein
VAPTETQKERRTGEPFALVPTQNETVADWVSTAWNAVPEEVVLRSIYGSGFDDDHREWFITKHDVYGARFLRKWTERNGSGAEEQALNVTHDDDISLALDELVIDE